MERTKIKDIYIKTNEIKIETVWLFNFYQILLYVLLLLLILLLLLSSIFHIINKCDRSYIYIDYQWLCTQHKIKWLFVDWYHFWLLKINVTNTNTLKNIFNAFTTLILRNMRILRITIFFTCSEFSMTRNCVDRNTIKPVEWSYIDFLQTISRLCRKKKENLNCEEKNVQTGFFFLLCTSLAIIVFMLICEISRNQTLIQLIKNKWWNDNVNQIN